MSQIDNIEYKKKGFNVPDPEILYWKTLNYAAGFSHFFATRSDQEDYPLKGFPKRILIGNLKEVSQTQGQAFFPELRNLLDRSQLMAGYLGYDLKNEIEDLSSDNQLDLDIPDGHFFIPEVIVEFHSTGIEISSISDPEEVFQQIEACEPVSSSFKPLQVNTIASMKKEDYLDNVEKIRQHIREGDIYELNLSQNFSLRAQHFNYISAYRMLAQLNPVPFSSLLKLNNLVILGASPERFLKKEGDKVWAQPMKGTRPRGKTPEEDQALFKDLENSEKDIAENMMIMDLVRNDLAKSCKPGSVRVEEMFRVYGFETVFQMITTVSGILKHQYDPIKAIENAFPMGSMTGAPKIKAMELIELYENRKRGVYSGALGFIDEKGDFDLCVNIRSLVYDVETGHLSYNVGGAITWDSIPENEFEECLWKARHLVELLGENVY